MRIAGTRANRSRIYCPPAMILAFLLAGCSDHEPANRIETRLIEEAPEQRLLLGKGATPEENFCWRFEDPDSLEAWKIMDGTVLRTESGALRLSASPDGSSSPRPLRLIRRAEVSAHLVDRIELRGRGFEGIQLRLFWAAADQEFARERRATLRVEPRMGAAGIATHAFDLAGISEWRGPIEHLRIDVEVPPGREVQLYEVCGSYFRVSAANLTETAWRVDLDHEVRSALIADIETPLELDAEIGRGHRLQFGYGVHPYLRSAARFRVTIPNEVLFEDTVTVDQANSWRDATVDLSHLAGRSVSLRLEVEVRSDGGMRSADDDAACCAFWSHPKLTAADPRGWSSREGDRPPNIVIILMDTLRADRLSLYGYEHQTSPRIDAWARRRAVTFKNAVAPSPWTLPSHISLFTGLDSFSHGFNHSLPAPESLMTLADLLYERGYSTMAVTGGVYLHPDYGLAQGFERFRYWPSGQPQREELARHVEETMGLLEDVGPQPFFLFFHSYAVHTPFHARQPFYDELFPQTPNDGFDEKLVTRPVPIRQEEGFLVRRRFYLRAEGDLEPVPESDLAKVSHLYDSGIAHADAQIARLLSRLEEIDNDYPTLVILTSDHGEALGERNLAAHAYLYDFNLMIPLIVAMPGGRNGGQVVDRQVRLIDVFPTALELAATETRPAVDGASLLPLIDDPEASFDPLAWSYASSSNFGVSLRVDNRLKYIFNNTAWPEIYGAEELYDLRNDPAENHNLAAEKEEAASLRERVRQGLDKSKGLRLDVSNGGSETLELRLAAPFLRPSKVKTSVPRTPSLERLSGSAVRIEVPAQSSLHLVFEAIEPAMPIELSARTAARRSLCKWRLSTDDLDAAVTFDLTSPECSLETDPDREIATRASLRLQSLTELQITLPSTDSELKDKLEALGYVQ